MSLSKWKSRPPWLLEYRSSTVFLIATVWTSSFTDYFLYAMIVPVMPTALSDRAGVPVEDREYWVSILLMCEAGVALLCCPLFGYLLDISKSRKSPFMLGLVLLGTSMGILTLARTVWLFVMARLLQGGATAMVAVAGLAMMTDTVEFGNLGQTIGYLGSAVTLGFLLGPLLGGLVYNVAGYNAVFGMAFAMIAVDLVMRVLVIEKKVARQWIQTEEPAPELQPEETDGTDEDSETVTGDTVPGYHTFPSEASTATLPQEGTSFAMLEIARQPRVLVSLWALMVQGLLYSAFDATLPLFVETNYGWTPFEAGMSFLPGAISAFFGPYFGYLSDRYGARIVTFTSFLLLSIPLSLLYLTTPNTTPSKVILLILLSLIGLLLNASMPALFVETQVVLEDMERAQPGLFGRQGAVAQAFGIQTMAQFSGLFLGPLWGGFVDREKGWAILGWSLAALMGLSALPALGLSGRPQAEVCSDDYLGEETGDGTRDEGTVRERLLST